MPPRRRYLPAVLSILLLGNFGAARAQSGAAANAPAGPEACEQHPRAVRVTVDNVRNADGVVTAELYLDAEESFLKKSGRLARMRVPAQPGPTRLCLLAPGPGRFAVTVFHDEDEDHKFNQDFLGIPTEGYGFSNNPGFRFGLPAMEEIRIVVDDRPLELVIRLTYP
jgi:uncharacterized protein (DUF2141 family)